MPASNVSVSAAFEPDKAKFSDTFKVTVDDAKKEVGTELTADVKAVATESAPEVPSTGVKYEWFRSENGTAPTADNTSGDTSLGAASETKTYTLVDDDKGKYVYVKVTYEGEEYNNTEAIYSAKVGPVEPKPVHLTDRAPQDVAKVWTYATTGDEVKTGKYIRDAKGVTEDISYLASDSSIMQQLENGYFDFDFMLPADGLSLIFKIGDSKSSTLQDQSAEIHINSADGGINIKQTFGKGSGKENMAIDGLDTSSMKINTWYRALLKLDVAAKTSTLSIYNLNEGDKIGDLITTAGTNTRMYFTNTPNASHKLERVMFSVSGVADTAKPYIDNVYAYTDKSYDTVITVQNETGDTKYSDVTVSVNDASNTSGTTGSDGTATLSLKVGEYDVTVTKQGYEAKEQENKIQVKAEGPNEFTVVMQEQPDPTYDVKIKTAPFATVTLPAGQSSTQSTSVDTQTVTADINGEATLSQIPVGSYKVNITSSNNYLKAITAEEPNLTVTAKADGSAAEDVEIPLTYTDDTMLYGDDFEAYSEDTLLLGGASAKPLFAVGTPFDIWCYPSEANAWDRFVIRTAQGKPDPNTVNKTELDGRYLSTALYSLSGSYTGTVSENIDHIAFDTNLDAVMGDKGRAGFSDTQFKFGDTVIFTLTAKPGAAEEASMDTIGIVVGDKKLASSAGNHPWVHVDIDGLTGEQAKVTITKYSSGKTLSDQPEDKIEATVEGIASGTVFSIAGVNANNVKNTVEKADPYCGMVIDNIEVYKAAE